MLKFGNSKKVSGNLYFNLSISPDGISIFLNKASTAVFSGPYLFGLFIDKSYASLEFLDDAVGFWVVAQTDMLPVKAVRP